MVILSWLLKAVPMTMLKKNCSSFLFVFWLCWVFVAAGMLSLAVASGCYFLVVMCGLLIAVASLVAEQGL